MIRRRDGSGEVERKREGEIERGGEGKMERWRGKIGIGIEKQRK